MTHPVTEAAVLEALSHVNDPELHKSLTSLGMVQNIRICEGLVGFELVLTTTACPLKDSIMKDARDAVLKVPGVETVEVTISGKTLSSAIPERQRIPGVKNIIAVSSGKGGVGKSTVSVNLACALKARGATVGILDADIHGPNIPLMMGVKKPQGPWAATEEGKPIPPENHGIKVMSTAFLVEDGQSLTLRGPMLHNAIRQFLFDIAWGELDYLIIDLPPGTGDAQISITQLAPITGAIIVTTPQAVSILDSKKGLNMFRQVKVPLLGIVENMSYYQLPDGTKDYIFGQGGGSQAAQELDVPFLGEVPLVSKLRQDADQGLPIMISEPEGLQAGIFKTIADQVVFKICELGILEKFGPLPEKAEPTPVA